MKPNIYKPQIPDISIQRWCVLFAFLNVKLLRYPLYEETPLKWENLQHFYLQPQTPLIHSSVMSIFIVVYSTAKCEL